MNISDFVTVGLLVLLEGLLSADNALVLAVLVLGLPRPQQQKALRYGLLGAFAFRTIGVPVRARCLTEHLNAVCNDCAMVSGTPHREWLQSAI